MNGPPTDVFYMQFFKTLIFFDFFLYYSRLRFGSLHTEIFEALELANDNTKIAKI